VRTLTRRVAVAFTLGCTAGAILANLGVMPAHAAVTVTPGQEAGACSAVYRMHHMDVLRDAGRAQHGPWERAWLHAWHAAQYADPEMRRDIHRWLRTRRGWSLVRYDCNPDEGL